MNHDDHILAYRTYKAQMARIEAEARYQASLKPPTFTVETDAEAMALMEAYGLKSLPDVLTLIGLYLDWRGHPGFAGFSKTARALGPLAQERVSLLMAATRGD